MDSNFKCKYNIDRRHSWNSYASLQINIPIDDKQEESTIRTNITHDLINNINGNMLF